MTRGEGNSSFVTRRLTAISAAILAPTVALGACSADSSPKPPENSAVTSVAARLKAGDAIAQRYVCDLVSVDSKQPVDAAKQMRLINLRLQLSEKPAIAELMAQYPSKHLTKSVVWEPATITGSLNRHRPPRNQGGTGVIDDRMDFGLQRRESNGQNGQLNRSLEIGTAYRVGTVASVVVVNEVMTKADSKYDLAEFDGVQVCGTMEFDGNRWQLSDKPSDVIDHVTKDVVQPAG